MNVERAERRLTQARRPFLKAVRGEMFGPDGGSKLAQVAINQFRLPGWKCRPALSATIPCEHLGPCGGLCGAAFNEQEMGRIDQVAYAGPHYIGQDR